MEFTEWKDLVHTKTAMSSHIPIGSLWLSIFSALAVGCCGVATTAQSTSRMFYIAQSSNFPLGQRQLAVQKLSERERTQLLALLVGRLPGNWDDATADDMFLMRVIGDEEAAQQLEKLYPIVPDTVTSYSSMPVILHRTVEIIHNKFKSHALQIAEDPLAGYIGRGDAARRLNEQDRKQAQSLLLKWIPMPDRSILALEGDLEVLSVVGDAQAAQRIEADRRPEYYGQMITDDMDDAVRSIRERLSATTRNGVEQNR
jgi:hypothetical protein